MYELSQIYMQTDLKSAIVLIRATYDDITGVLTLEDASEDATSNWRADSAMAHPDGSVSQATSLRFLAPL